MNRQRQNNGASYKIRTLLGKQTLKTTLSRWYY